MDIHTETLSKAEHADPSLDDIHNDIWKLYHLLDVLNDAALETPCC
ncbi:MAG: hypothetical protein KF874_14610 [Rhizobiaceae bacterium]|nr:hypothetical protein [Rhizobiaceae bacterium]